MGIGQCCYLLFRDRDFDINGNEPNQISLHSKIENGLYTVIIIIIIIIIRSAVAPSSPIFVHIMQRTSMITTFIIIGKFVLFHISKTFRFVSNLYFSLAWCMVYAYGVYCVTVAFIAQFQSPCVGTKARREKRHQHIRISRPKWKKKWDQKCHGKTSQHCGNNNPMESNICCTGTPNTRRFSTIFFFSLLLWNKRH